MSTFNYDHLPQYKALIESQEHVRDSDFNPIVIDQILTKEEIDEILQQMEEYPKENIKIQTWGGQGVYVDLQPSDKIKEKLTGVMSNIIGEPMIVEQISIVKYSPEFDYMVKLFPHYDTRPVDMFLIDVQLKTNEPWGVIVEGKTFNLEDGQGLVFSGTSQMHWREKKVLPAHTDINMMFCWFTHVPPKYKKRDHDRIMRTRSSVLMHETGINSDKIETEIVDTEVKVKAKDSAK
jgi:hypothetical protein